MLALSFHVDYWDRLGWKDPFSSPAATERQQRYAELLGLATVYTPQIVVDGKWQAVGSNRAEVERAISARPGATPTRCRSRSRSITGGPRSSSGRAATGLPAAVLLIGFDRRQVSAVARGENGGRTLAHADVVRSIEEVGQFDGRAKAVEAPIPRPAERLAVILQAAGRAGSRGANLRRRAAARGWQRAVKHGTLCSSRDRRAGMQIERLDHLVLTVADIARTCDFYTRVLGMEVVHFGEGRTALRFGQQKINLHPADRIPGLVADKPTPGSGDLCFITETPLAEVTAHLDTMRGADRRRARAARRRDRHDPIGLYPRPRPEPGGNLELLRTLRCRCGKNT